MKPVLLYVKQSCPFCHRAKRLLDQKGVSYQEIDVTGDTQRRSEMEKRSGGHTVPQIFIGGEPIGGSDELVALEEDGKLDALLR